MCVCVTGDHRSTAAAGRGHAWCMRGLSLLHRLREYNDNKAPEEGTNLTFAAAVDVLLGLVMQTVVTAPPKGPDDARSKLRASCSVRPDRSRRNDISRQFQNSKFCSVRCPLAPVWRPSRRLPRQCQANPTNPALVRATLWWEVGEVGCWQSSRGCGPHRGFGCPVSAAATRR